MCQRRCYFVILCCNRKFNFLSLSSYSPSLFHFCFYRQVTCNRLKRGRRGEQMEREQRERGWESGTQEIPHAQWEPLALLDFDLKRIKRTLPKEVQQDFNFSALPCSGSPPFCLSWSSHDGTLNIKIHPFHPFLHKPNYKFLPRNSRLPWRRHTP